MDNREKCRERYYFLKEHGICVACGQESAVRGKTRCLYCASLCSERSLKNYYKTREATRDRRNAYAKEYRQKRRESGLCLLCGRPAVKGKSRCAGCAAKVRQYNNDRNHEKGTMPRDMLGDGYHCAFCGGNVLKRGDKCCSECLERERKWSAEQREKIDRTNHWWKKDNNIVFHKKGGSNEKV